MLITLSSMFLLPFLQKPKKSQICISETNEMPGKNVYVRLGKIPKP